MIEVDVDLKGHPKSALRAVGIRLLREAGPVKKKSPLFLYHSEVDMSIANGDLPNSSHWRSRRSGTAS